MKNKKENKTPFLTDEEVEYLKENQDRCQNCEHLILFHDKEYLECDICDCRDF